ncbi:hypothetical protein LTR37_020123 [Vermiconidia calcicola]|uniref:Uncharacterized protein n=1 Tax=Vermiconidia calcicola TaxID=1690605 RepID=A0ACC3MCC2_9PEZI|nr:hypothetical protein LTR37_020123 [Vermiconidia calcicola]
MAAIGAQVGTTLDLSPRTRLPAAKEKPVDVLLEASLEFLEQPNSSVVQGVLVSPKPANTVGQCHDADLDREGIATQLLDDPGWMSLPLPGMLGLPLKFIKWPTATGEVNYNHLIQVLSIDTDCSRSAEKLEEEGFGQTAFPPIRGAVMVVREDGKALEEERVEVLPVYVDTHLMEIIEFGGGKWKYRAVEEVRELQARMRKKVSVEAFGEFWEEYKAMKVEAGVKEWEGASCPVKLYAEVSWRRTLCRSNGK